MERSNHIRRRVVTGRRRNRSRTVMVLELIAQL